MDIFNLPADAFLSFLLTLIRFSLILFLMPFFGGESLPKMVKAALCLVLTLALWPQVSAPAELFPAHPGQLVIMLLGEVVLGMTLALMVNILFGAVQTGGQIMGFQMGFAMVNVVDPLTGTSEAATAHFLYMLTVLVFLSLNGHLFLIQALAKSFTLVPPGQLFLSPQISTTVLDFSTQLFSLAVKVAAPLMASLFLVDLALALVGRAAPQMHILLLGFPIKITVGFFFMSIVFSMLALFVENYVSNLNVFFVHLMNMMHR